MDNLFQPFEFLKLRHPELMRYAWYSAAAALFWLASDVAHLVLTGRTINFFAAGGVLERVATMLSVMVGVYFGLAGVFVASTSPWLAEPMPNGVAQPGGRAAMTRGAFFLCLLVYCAASGTMIVLSAAFLPPILIPLATAALAALSERGFPYSDEVRATLSIICSTAMVLACAHLAICSLLSFRFLARSGQS